MFLLIVISENLMYSKYLKDSIVLAIERHILYNLMYVRKSLLWFGVFDVRKLLKDFDFVLMITPILLAGFGVVMVYSASMLIAVVQGLDSSFYLTRQLIWFCLSVAVFLFVSIFPYKNYIRLMPIILIGSIAGLVLVLLFGESANNAVRAISLFGFNLQPAEFVKLAIVIYLAFIYSKKQSRINNFVHSVLPPLILSGFLIFLIVLQPDIGTASIIVFVVIVISLSAGVKMKYLGFIGGVLAIILTPIIYFSGFVTPTRIERFKGAYDPFTDASDSGFQLIQSYVAIGGGDLLGQGLGQSIQKLGYLYGAHTDFIMAIIAEELGVFGIVIVMGLFITIVVKGVMLATKCKDGFGSLLAIGITSLISIQAFINLGSISGILPITGVPLPFISYGGSSLLTCMIAMGILNNIAKTVNGYENITN